MRHVGGKPALVVALIAIFALTAASSAVADPRYEVMNAPEGVYWRAEPNWSAAERITGFGVYNGTIVEVHCYQSGTTVEGSADTMWEQATDVGGRGYGSGWLNEHFINDGQPINTSSPGVPPCIAPPPHPEEHPVLEEHPPGGFAEPPPTGALVFTIVNAEGGIYYRNSPKLSDTSATSGVGVYNGDRVELVCGGFGDPVGAYADTAWSKVKNLSRPSIGEGWVNEHYINDGAVSGHWPAGVQPCPFTPVVVAPSTNNSAFYSPNDKGSGLDGITVADTNQAESSWAPGGCNTSKAANFPATVNTLAGWSKARLGPMYFLAAHQERQSQIHTVILFDPGNEKEMNESCDGSLSPKITSLLVTWLQNNPSNELFVLTGFVSEEHAIQLPLNLGFGQSYYHGLWNYYFKELWSQPWSVRSRARVCDYNDLGHAEVLADFYGIVKLAGDGARPSGCPISQNAPAPVQWNP